MIRHQKLSVPAVVESLESRRLLSPTVDVRVAGGGKAAVVDEFGDVVNLEVYAVVTGADPASPEGFQSLMGSFLSGNGAGVGSTRGTLFVDVISPFAAAGFADSTDPTDSPANTTDLDGDGDLDTGRNDNTDAIGFVVARASSVRFSGGTALANGREWKIANMTYTVTQLRTGSTTEINYRRRLSDSSALWVQDGNQVFTGSSALFITGTPVVVTRAADTLPPAVVFKQFALAQRTQYLELNVHMRVQEDLQNAPTVSSLQLTNLTTNQNFSATSFVSALGPNDPLSLSWTRTSFLPNGDYRARLPGGTLQDLSGNTQAANTDVTFTVRHGDTNGDFIIDVDDYFNLDVNYARRASLAAPTYAQGDFNNDELLNADDYLLIDQSFLATHLSGVAAPQPPGAPSPGPEPFSTTPIEHETVLEAGDDLLA